MKGKLGFWEIFSIGVGGMIGGGIFAVLGLSLELTDGAAQVAFLIAGLVALATSYSYAKLTRRYPSEGGTIEFLVQAYGDGLLAGTLNVMLLGAYIVMIALYAHAFASYGASALGPSHYAVAKAVLTVLVISAFTLVNMLGAKTSGLTELALVTFKVSVLVGVSLLALPMVDWARFSPSTWPGPAAIIAGGMIIFLAYEGFELISNAAVDARSMRDLVRALYASVATVITIYILVALVSGGTMSPEEVARARDYALAMLALTIIGAAGYTLVVAAALASTSSAINATLYGTARISYMIAKLGELPRALRKRVWSGAYEGLLIISLLSLLLALLAPLETISVAGSGAFLIIFASVNIAALKLREQTGANPILALAGALLTLASLTILTLQTARSNPESLTVLAVLIAGSALLEYTYRRITGRRLPRYVDRRLMEHESLIREWRAWLPQLAREIRSLIREAEVYLAGSVARGEHHRASDIDLVIVTPRPLTGEERERVEEAVRRIARPPLPHTVDIHYAHGPEAVRVVREKERKREARRIA